MVPNQGRASLRAYLQSQDGRWGAGRGRGLR